MGKWNHSRNFFVNLPIKWKFSLIVVPLMLLMGLANTIAIERYLAEAFYRELLADSQALGNTISTGISPHLRADDREAVRNLFATTINLENDLAYLYLTGADGEVLVHSFAQQAFPAEILEGSNISETEDPRHTVIHLPQGDIHEVRVALRNGDLGTLHVGMLATALTEPQALVRNSLLAITFCVTLLGLAILMLMIRLITKPLADLAGAVKAIGREDLDVRMATSDDEIGQLARAFNLMTAEMHANQERREAAERARLESERRYRFLLDNIDLGVSLINKDFEVILANAAQGRMFNRTPESLVGRKCYREFEKREAVCDHCPGARAMLSGRCEEAEAVGRRDDGGTFPVMIRAFPVRDEQQEIAGFIEIVSDITTKENAAETLQRIKSLETIGQLAGGLAHDFNNLLTAISGNIELARIGLDPNKENAARLQAAGKSCEQARRLTSQLLTFAKGGMPIKKLAHLPAILEESCRFSLSGSSLHYLLNAPENLWPVEIDSSQMSQVIQNLLTNAREAMAANPTGKVFVLAENVELEADTRLPLPPGRYVKLVIADEGEGIAPEALAKIFTPYYTTKEMGAEKGTGLGLAVCHSIVYKHGGHITVVSGEKGGATFTIYLPALDKSHAPAAEVSEDLSAARPASLRILVLEDEKEVAHIATSFLATLHHQGEVAASGSQAVRLVQEAMASGQPFDLLLLDLTIRGGMGGEEVLRKIREIDPAIPAIVSSGYTEHPVMVGYRNHGFQAALPKPFNQATLRAAIAAATEEAGRGEGKGNESPH